MSDAKDLSGRIRAEQLRELAEVALLTAIFVAINPTLVLLVFWKYASHSLLLAWWGANIAYCAAMLLDRDWRQAAISPWPHRRLITRTTLLGLIWGVLPFLLIPVADSGQMLMIGLIATGMTTSGAIRLAIVPAAAYAFVWGLTLPTIAAFFICEVPYAMPVSAFMLSGSLFISRHVTSFSKFQTRLLLDKIDLGEQNGTIQLLLKDFSSQSSDWLWQTDASGRIVEPSARFCQAAGRSAEEIEGMALARLFGPDPGIFDRLTQRREILRDLQQSVPSGAGLRHWSLTGQPVFDTAGEFSG